MTTLFVAATGGHLDQLDHLARRLPDGGGPGHWVTSANEQSRSLLAGRDATFVPYVGVRDLPGVLRCLPVARRMRRQHGITRAISTGSGIALGFLPLLAARGVECHYIESAARVSSPSITGRLMALTPGVRTYTQYAGWADDRWRMVGSVFDAYERRPAPPPAGERLEVVVTLGSAVEFPFRRLIEALVPILRPGGALEAATGRAARVLWQTGGTPVDGLGIRATPFLSSHELTRAMDVADVVVAHAGTGSALGALEAGRFPLLAARRRREGEAGDDHQRELADELSRRGLARAVEPEAVSVRDVLSALSTAVRRVATPPPIALRA